MASKKEGQVSPETLVRFGADLRKARIDAGLTQEQVGALCGKTTVKGKPVVMNKSNVSKIERGQEPNLALDTITRLAAAVGMDIDVRLIRLRPAIKKPATKKDQTS